MPALATLPAQPQVEIHRSSEINPYAHALKIHTVDDVIYVPIGQIDHKEYYFNTQTGEISWRVPDIREAIRVGVGRKVVAADYSQIEVKIMAFLSGDPFLLNAINADGKDFHTFMAAGVAKLDYDEMIAAMAAGNQYYKKLRGDVKKVTFGIPLTHSGLMKRFMLN